MIELSPIVTPQRMMAPLPTEAVAGGEREAFAAIYARDHTAV